MANFNDGTEGLSACECPICFNFISETLPPMSMPCGHTLCSGCVNNLVAEASLTANASGCVSPPMFRCPICREWVKQAAVHPNVTLRELIAQLASIGVKPSSPESHKARVLSALHVNFHEIEMGKSLDRGAYGEVFRGVWRGNDIAVKMFSSGTMTPEAMQAFQREVFVMNCLRHPNVVMLMGACQTPPKLAILMEFVGGGSLYKLVHIDKAALPLEEASSIGGDICCGLQYLHSINILHRDLKSKNVLLSGSPPGRQAKLCDFGLARMRLESATLTGNVGTIHWSAPEVLTNVRYKFPADVYGLGMVLYEMACGRIPFHSLVPLAVMMAVAINKLKPDIPATVDPRMSKIIYDCISWEPHERPSVGGVLIALRDLVHHREAPKNVAAQGRTEHLPQSDSLGVVFLSVSDTAEFGHEDEKPQGVVQKLDHSPHSLSEKSASEKDRSLAWKLMEEERNTLFTRDEELAHQLQLRENSYLTSSNPSGKGVLSKSVLGSVTSLKTKGSVCEETNSMAMPYSPKDMKSTKARPNKELIMKSNPVSSVSLALTAEPSAHSVKFKQLWKRAASLARKMTRSFQFSSSTHSIPPPTTSSVPPHFTHPVRLSSTHHVHPSSTYHFPPPSTHPVPPPSTHHVHPPSTHHVHSPSTHPVPLPSTHPVPPPSIHHVHPPSTHPVPPPSTHPVSPPSTSVNAIIKQRLPNQEAQEKPISSNKGSTLFNQRRTSQHNNGPASIQKALLDFTKRGNLSLVKEYHMKGASLIARDANGLAPLHHAARLGRKEVVQYIVDNITSASLDMVEEERIQTALHKAAWFGYLDICMALVEAGASFDDCKDYQGCTPYDRALQSGNQQLVEYLKEKR